MKLILALTVLTLLATAIHAAPRELRTTSRTPKEVAAMVEAVGGCNANVCFALDGSGSISEAEYESSKNFVLDVISAIAGNPLELAAVQYGRFPSGISPLTADVGSFVDAVESSTMIGSSRTRIGGGITWCARQLRRVKGEANKMVVMGDGRNNLGGNPVRRANRFRRKTGGKVCTVGIGFKNKKKLFKIAGRDPNLVLTVDDYFELADILEDMVEMVCGIELQ